MKVAITLTLVTPLCIYLRATNPQIPNFSSLWWSWIIFTVFISGATGWSWCMAYMKHQNRKYVKWRRQPDLPDTR